MKYYQVEHQIVNPISQFKLIKKTPQGKVYQCNICGHSEEYKGRHCTSAPRKGFVEIRLDVPEFAHECNW